MAAGLTFRRLLAHSARQLAARPAQVRRPLSRHVFATGARWMGGWLPPAPTRLAGPAGATPSFTRYGLLKYGSSLLAALAGMLALLGWGRPELLPLAGLAFYLVEVHFLFLFPLLLDGVPHPLRRSVQATYRVGLGRALAWTLGLAVFMLSGLLERRQPWRRWHIGCLAVICWYHAEVRAGLRRAL